MKSFESEVMDLGYYSEEEITREEYESMSDNARENLAIKRFEDVSGVSVTKFYLKKPLNLTNEQLMVISQLKVEKKIETIKKIIIGFAILVAAPIIIGFLINIANAITVAKYY